MFFSLSLLVQSEVARSHMTYGPLLVCTPKQWNSYQSGPVGVEPFSYVKIFFSYQ